MRRDLKIGLYALGALAGLALLAVLAAFIAVQTQWFRDRVREAIVRELENATGGRVELGGFDFDGRALRATVTGLVIHGAEEAGQDPLFRAESVEVVLRIVSAFKRDVDIQSLVVRKPQVNLIVYPGGRTNVPEPKVARKRDKNPVEEILALAIGRFQFDNGELRVQERRVPLDARGENLRARFFYEAAQPRYRGEIAFRKLLAAAGGLRPLPLDVEAKLAVEKDRLRIGDLRVGYEQSTVDVTGAVENFADPRADLTYSAHIQMKEVAPVLRVAGVPNRGDLELGGRLVLSGETGYELSGKLRARGLVVRQHGLRVENVAATSDVAARAGRIELRNLLVSALGGSLAGRFELEQFRDFRLDSAIRGFSLAQLARVEGESRVVWDGLLSGPLRLSGAFRDGEARDLRLETKLAVAPAPGPNPVNGSIDLAWSQRSGLYSFGNSFFATPATRVEFSGGLGRRMDVNFESTNLRDIQPAIALLSTGPVEPVPVTLQNGIARFRGVVTGPVKKPQLDGHAVLKSFVIEKRQFDSLEADVVASGESASGTKIKLVKQQLTAAGSGRVELKNWKPVAESPVSGTFAVRAPNVAAAIAEAGLSLPVTGALAGSVELSGTLGELRVHGRGDLLKGVAWEQPYDRVEGDVRYSAGLLEVSSATVQAGPSQVRASGVFTHPKDNWSEGRLKFQVATPGLLLAALKEAQQQSPGLDGRMEGQMAGEIALAQSGFRIGSLNGTLALRNLSVERKPVGDLDLVAVTGGRELKLELGGNLAGARVRGDGQFLLEGGYPARGTLEFSRLEFSTLLARFRPRPADQGAPFRGFIEGRLSFAGSTLDRQSWQAKLELPAIELRPSAEAIELARSQELVLRNRGPVVAAITSKSVRIEQAQLVGKDTDLTVSGAFAFGSRNPLDLRVKGGVNLAALRDFEPSLYASGKLSLDASLRGSLDRPDVYGRVELQNVSFNLAGFPNGLDKVNGVIFLYRDRATIDKLTAESGGGNVSVTGFVAFGSVATYALQAKADQVRVRYPEGVSTTVNSALSFTGTSERSVLGGEVTITRFAFNPQTDLGSILARSAQPIPTPSRSSRFQQGVRFDVEIQTSPQVRFETAIARSVQAEADLRLRGDATRPVLLGSVLVNQGEVIFFGNRYTIDSGEILFVNAAKIEPIVNLHLATRVRGIDVTLNVNGPLSKPTVAYRSDPPLPFSDIVALLATGTAPTTTPGLVGARSELSQSWEQAGASALVSQAITSPLAGRLQRFFGVSRLKIDPSVRGADNTPEARLTLEQQVTQDLTFIYITNLARAQQQTFRIEWDFTRDWQAVAVREGNGLFGVDFLYKKRFK